MNRQGRFLAATVTLLGVILLLPVSRSAEAHGFFRFGFAYPVVYRPVFYPPPVYDPPPAVYSYYRPAYWGWYRRAVYRPIHRRVAYRHVVHRHWCSCRCCR